MQTAEYLPIGKIKPNEKNPRVIKDKKFFQLVESLKTFPKMMEIRPIVVDEKFIILGGNMRWKAAKEAGLKTVPVMFVEDLTEEQKNEFIIKDNVGFGEWDWENLANEWDTELLNQWGIDTPDWDKMKEEDSETPKEEMKAWFINIRMDSEQHAQMWYEKLIREGLDVKIVT